MKLTKGKLLETIRRKNEGWTTYQARKIAGVSTRRVNQVWKEYQETGKVPEIGKKIGRPAIPLQEWEVKMVKETYAKYRVCASTLEKLIDRDSGRHIQHNKVHRIMVQEGFAKPKGKKDVRKKDWIRYERMHSLTAVHLDWFQDESNWVLPVLDDASRKLLSLIEEDNATTEAFIQAMVQALMFWKLRNKLSGEFGFTLEFAGVRPHAAEKCDMEAWFPRQNNFREVVSCANCTSYQATSLNIRYHNKKTSEKEYVHTLNSTAVATGRTIVAIAENYQNKDGTITVSDVLVPYVGKRVIGK